MKREDGWLVFGCLVMLKLRFEGGDKAFACCLVFSTQKRFGIVVLEGARCLV